MIKEEDIGTIFTDITDDSKWRLVGIAYEPTAAFRNAETDELRTFVIGSLLSENMIKEKQEEKNND